MMKFPPELIVHRDNVCYLLYVAGGLLMTLTAGSQCVDEAVRTAQNPANLLHLSNTLLGLMGLRHQIQVHSVAKGKPKRLFFTVSFSRLFDIMRPTLQGTHHFKIFGWLPEEQTNPEPVNRGLTRRHRIYYILICGVSCLSVLTLRIGNGSNKLQTYKPSNQHRWLINFSSKAQARGDVIFLLMAGQIGQMSSGSGTNDVTHERHPTCLTLGLSALSVLLLWMFLPHIAVCAVICLGWTVHQHIH